MASEKRSLKALVEAQIIFPILAELVSLQKTLGYATQFHHAGEITLGIFISRYYL